MRNGQNMKDCRQYFEQCINNEVLLLLIHNSDQRTIDLAVSTRVPTTELFVSSLMDFVVVALRSPFDQEYVLQSS